ncbi:Pre-mRNA processing ribonucleoprotein [Methanococcus maripaludis]|uniref:Nucleolar protein 56 n=1 Tax=Methanococcus maripaludis TaxID=39152 RepID=A0A8T4H5U8_METMI|nr:Pre-mRNA processing ribonucleoprotein [Methanococcus maripaludis]MBM7408579.1 nucleolar protein 56 [Methanococcus maripaludis]MBP2220112.1 nucleolar protein 56 [Methanococcus maripaludis]
MLFIAFAPFGAFALEANSKNDGYSLDDIKYYKIFENEDIPKIMYALRQGDFEIIAELKNEWEIEEEDVSFEYTTSKNPLGELIRDNLYELGQKYEVFEDESDFVSKMNVWATAFTKSMMKKSSEQKDKLIVQTVNALDNLDETLNLFSERLREWYSLYFPEMDNIVKKHDIYVSLVSEYGDREEYTRTKLKKTMPSNVARTISLAAKESMGADVSEFDLKIMKNLADEIKSMYEYRESLQEYLETSMNEIAPNLTKVAGASLGARLISLAGGIERLLRLPASTIQVIGAEKALFAHLRERALPPKHGVIFQHPLIQGSPWWIHGKIARAISCKISIAIRADAFGNDISDMLIEDMNKKVAQIKEKFPEPTRKRRPRPDTRSFGNKGGQDRDRKSQGDRKPSGKRGDSKKGGKPFGKKPAGKDDRRDNRKGDRKPFGGKPKNSGNQPPKERSGEKRRDSTKKVKAERKVIGKTSSQN